MGRTVKVVLDFEQRQIILVLTLVAWIPCLSRNNTGVNSRHREGKVPPGYSRGQGGDIAYTANLQAAVVNLSNIATLTQTVGHFGRQPIPLFNAARPHKWAKDAKTIIMGWSDDHYSAITDNPVSQIRT